VTLDSQAPRVLVAGLGNIFFGDDAFGVEVARRLRQGPLPEDIRVLDIGTRSVHLTYELIETRYDLVILVDIVSRGAVPGTLCVLEPDQSDSVEERVLANGHAMRPDQVIAAARRLGGSVGRALIVGCEPVAVDSEPGLSGPVAARVEEAARLVLHLAAQS
jgi:hydrogenase maturation protease